MDPQNQQSIQSLPTQQVNHLKLLLLKLLYLIIGVFVVLILTMVAFWIGRNTKNNLATMSSIINPTKEIAIFDNTLLEVCIQDSDCINIDSHDGCPISSINKKYLSYYIKKIKPKEQKPMCDFFPVEKLDINRQIPKCVNNRCESISKSFYCESAKDCTTILCITNAMRKTPHYAIISKKGINDYIKDFYCQEAPHSAVVDCAKKCYQPEGDLTCNNYMCSSKNDPNFQYECFRDCEKLMINLEKS